MKSLAIVMTLLLALPTAQSLAAFQVDVNEYQLDNGLKLLVAPDTTAPTVSVYTFVNAGSRDEDRPGITGLAHVFEHMMFRGTEKYPDYSSAVAPMGAQTNAYTGQDYTAYFINAEAHFLKQMLEIEADRIRNLVFTRETFRAELGPVKEERRRSVDDDPGGTLEVELWKTAFKQHTYHHPVIGWSEDLEKNMTFQDGLQFKNRFYAPNNCYLVIAGNVDPEQAHQWVEDYYGDWARGEAYTPHILQEPEQTEPREARIEWKDNLTPALVTIGYRGFDPGDNLEAYAAVRLINEMLFTDWGVATQLLKNQLDFVESIRASFDLTKDPGLNIINLRMKQGAGISAATDTLTKLISNFINSEKEPEALTRARNNLRADMIYRLDRPARIASTIGMYQLVTGDHNNLGRLYDLYETVPWGEIRAVAAKMFAPEHRTTVKLLPKQAS